jgi:hypothetical protein
MVVSRNARARLDTSLALPARDANPVAAGTMPSKVKSVDSASWPRIEAVFASETVP